MTGTFVTVGNAKQPFPRLLHAIEDVIDILPQPVVVQAGHTKFSHKNMEISDFISKERFSELFANTRLLITHGGCGSAIEAIRANKKPIVMARRAELGEHVNNHQVDFVQELASLGKIFLVDNSRDIRHHIHQSPSFQQEVCPSSGPPPLVEAIAHLLSEYAS